MRFDLVSGWELMAVQVVALAVLVATLWAVGVAFQRSRTGRTAILLGAPVLGAVVAVAVLNTDEAIVSSYLFAVVLFSLGTLAMSVMLLAAIPQTRGAAVGGLVAGGLLIVAFVLSYYAIFTFGAPRWLQQPG